MLASGFVSKVCTLSYFFVLDWCLCFSFPFVFGSLIVMLQLFQLFTSASLGKILIRSLRIQKPEFVDEPTISICCLFNISASIHGLKYCPYLVCFKYLDNHWIHCRFETLSCPRSLSLNQKSINSLCLSQYI